MRYVDKGMDLHPIDSLSQIVRAQSPRAWARMMYIDGKKSVGCAFCGVKHRLAFYHVDPATESFNIQKAGLMVSEEELDAEIEKCVVVCVSCRMRMLGPYRAPAHVKDKTLFYTMRENYAKAKPPELPKSSTRRKVRRN